MRSIIFTLFGLLLFEGAMAQKPEIVYSFAREKKPITWYRQQATVWKNEIDRNPKDARAWFYFYRANRSLNMLDTSDKRSHKEKAEAMRKLVEEMGKNIPETYEYNWCLWQNEGNNFVFLETLKKVDAMGEGHWEHYDFMINWGEIDRDIHKRDEYAKKWFESGEVSGGLLFYSYNVMMGAKPNAIIFTAGDNDTYPIWILQAQGIRRDITVLNFSLLHIDEYRHKIFKELGVEKWEMNETADNEKKFREGIIKHVAANRKNFPVYLVLTATGHKEYVSPIEENLYLTGLAYEYSTKSMDNMALLKRNFEHNFALDYIDKALFPDVSAAKVKEINYNYIVPMLKLFDHYKIAGDLQRMEWMKGKLLSIARGTDDEQEIKKHIE